MPDTMPDGRPWLRISIVTPVRNGAEFIEETIRSVLLQGYAELEYVIVDGGSTDGTLDIVRKYDKWLTGWISESDSGMSEAINKGWKRTSGEIVAWLNSDDRYEPNALGDVAGVFRANPEATLAYGLCRVYGGGPDYSMGRPYDLIDGLKSGVRPWIGQPASFFSRRAVERAGFLDHSLRQSMDTDLLQRVAAVGRIVFVPRVWASFMVRSGQLSQRNASDPAFLLDRESVKALANLYSIPHLDPEVKRLERRAKSITRLGLALAARRRGLYVEAIWNLLLTINYPVLYTERQWLALFLEVVMGSRSERLCHTLGRLARLGQQRDRLPR